MACGEETVTLSSSLQFQWEVKDIFSDIEKKDESVVLRSPYFHVAGFQWYLKFYPFVEIRSKECASLYLHLKPGTETVSKCRQELNFTFGVKKGDDSILKLGDEISYLFDVNNQACGYTQLLQIAEIQKRRKELAPSGVLTLTCTIRPNSSVEPLSECPISLSKEFQSMFNSNRGCDATVTVQGQEFPVHKNLLMSRSKVLMFMFENEMKDKYTGYVNIVIEDCFPEVFQDFLIYLYFGTLRNSSNNFLQLYYIAHKYDMKELISECAEYMMEKLYLSIDNVLDAIIIGHQFDKTYLKTKAQDFFNNNFSKIVHSAKWDSLLEDNFTLFDELLKSYEKHRRTRTVYINID